MQETSAQSPDQRALQGDLDVYVSGGDGEEEEERVDAWTSLLEGAGYTLVRSSNCPYALCEDLGYPLLVSSQCGAVPQCSAAHPSACNTCTGARYRGRL